MIGKLNGSIAAMLVAWAATPAIAQDESYQWLEDPKDAKALTWASEQTASAQKRIRALPEREVIETELKSLLAASDPPPQFFPLGKRLLKVQRSATNPHGTIFVTEIGTDGKPGEWLAVLDIDTLRKSEGKPYELQTYDFGNACLAPEYSRCLLALSPAGADDSELREFDLERGTFVEDGFRLPASRNMVSWFGPDQILIMHTVGDAEKLPTGWAKAVHLWKRGSDIGSARKIFDGRPTDAIILINGTRDRSDGSPVGVIQRYMDYSTSETYLVRADGSVEKTSLPAQGKMMVSPVGGGRIISQLSAPATVNGKTLPAETVVAYDASAGVPAGERLSVVSLPVDGEYMNDPFGGFSIGTNSVRLVKDRRGTKRIDTIRFRDGAWHLQKGKDEAVGVSISFGASDPASDAVIAKRTGFLLPSQVDLLGAKGGDVRLFQEQPIIDADKFAVDLKTARSRDGTKIDYFLLRPNVSAQKGATPTLMTGYGAFGISLNPGYFEATVGGRSLAPWLMRGGALALPLIRGGGDRGAAWHDAAIREKRQASYDDFAAVTEALIAEGFTRPEHIGVFGMSNGGLLSATMGIQRPDLYEAIVSDVPLTDLIRMPLMGMGAAWTNEYGDPTDPKMAEIIKRYSPFQNIREGVNYPAFMVTVATSDNRVGPGHARKLAAKLIDVNADTYFLEDQEGGHGVSDPLSRPDLMADRITFLIDKLM